MKNPVLAIIAAMSMFATIPLLNCTSGSVLHSQATSDIDHASNSDGSFPDRLRRILSVVNNVGKIAETHEGKPLNDNDRGRIDKEVDQINNPHDLAALARMCRAVESQTPPPKAGLGERDRLKGGRSHLR
jgi:hypothetical protein